MAQDLKGIPSGAEVWKVDGKDKYVVYYSPEGNPPVPMIWHIPDPSEEEALAGSDKAQLRNDREISSSQLQQAGAIHMGTSKEIANTTENPFESFVSDLEKEMQVRPWLRDPEVLATVTGALLEGRAVTEAELKTTDWWQSHNESERRWLTLSESDPATANQIRKDNRIRVRNMLIRGGHPQPSEDLVSVLADNMTTGSWSETELQEQVRLVTDPFAPGELDPSVESLVQADREITRKGRDKVRDTVHKWLGTYFGNWDEGDIQHWAGRYRNDPDALQELEEQLQAQKNALFPEYNETATWSEIATPWKNVVRQQWGQEVSDDSRVLYQVMRMNDIEKASDYLREKGIENGVGSVVDRFVDSVTKAFGGNVRGDI